MSIMTGICRVQEVLGSRAYLGSESDSDQPALIPALQPLMNSKMGTAHIGCTSVLTTFSSA